MYSRIGYCLDRRKYNFNEVSHFVQHFSVCVLIIDVAYLNVFGELKVM